MAITKKEFNDFTAKMWNRLQRGQEKYGDSYDTEDMVDELFDELYDAINYIFMAYLNLKRKFKK